MRRRMAILCLALMALPLFYLASNPVASSEPQIVDSFVDKYNGRTFTFVEDGEQVLVRFADTAALDRRQAMIEGAGLVEVHSSDNVKNVGVYRATGALSARQASDRLSSESNVIEAKPLLVDNDGFPQFSVAGEMTVQFVPDLDKAECERVIREFGSTIITEQRTPGYYTISIPEGKGLYEAIRDLNEEPLVWFSEESMLGFNDHLFVPNDPRYNSQWHLNNTGQDAGGTPGADIHAEEAWDITTGDPNVIMVIIDTGGDIDHPDLAPNLYPQGGEDWNFAEGANTNPNDTSGHGTSCSGLACGVGDNGVGVAGVCMDCRWIPLKINLGSGQNQNRADAINYAVSFQNANPDLRLVLSNSWRMSSGSFAAVEAACQNAADNDVPILVASGNGNGAVDFPAKYASTLAIGASSPCDERKNPNSCDGETWWGSNFGAEQDVVAPGVLMDTTAIGGYTSGFNGTSSACPTAAGAVGLILSLNSSLTYQEVEDILEMSADDQVGPANEDPPGWDQWMGHGRINAHEALLNTPGLEPPTVSNVSPDWGSVNQSTNVTITGENFFGQPNVSFGGQPATFVTVINDTTILAGTPAYGNLDTVDVIVATPSGNGNLTDAFTFAATLFAPGTASPGQEIIVSGRGPANGDWGVLYDYFDGSRFKRGLQFPIPFTPGVWGLMKDSFRTSDAPLNPSGQGNARYTLPDAPQLPSFELHVVAVFDGNGPAPGNNLTLAREKQVVQIQ